MLLRVGIRRTAGQAVARLVACCSKVNPARRVEGGSRSTASSASSRFWPRARRARQVAGEFRRYRAGRRKFGREDFLRRPILQAGTEGQQVSGEVAAIDAGNITWQQGLEGSGVIPIVEMAPVPLEALHGGQGMLRALDQLACGQVTKVAGRQVGQQRQPHVGW